MMPQAPMPAPAADPMQMAAATQQALINQQALLMVSTMMIILFTSFITPSSLVRPKFKFLSCPLRPSRWPCRQWLCPSSRHRSTRRRSRRDWRGRNKGRGNRKEGRRMRGNGGVDQNGVLRTVQVHLLLSLAHLHPSSPKHLRLKSPKTTVSLRQRYLYIYSIVYSILCEQLLFKTLSVWYLYSVGYLLWHF